MATALLVGSCVGDEEARLRPGDCLRPGFDAIALNLGFLEYVGSDNDAQNALIYPLEQDGFPNPVGALERDGFVNADSNWPATHWRPRGS